VVRSDTPNNDPEKHRRSHRGPRSGVAIYDAAIKAEVGRPPARL